MKGVQEAAQSRLGVARNQLGASWESIGNRLGINWESTGSQARKLSGAVQRWTCRYFFSRAKALVASTSSTHTRLLSVWALQRLILESPIEQPLPNPKMPLEQEPSQ